jgi:hypothetical protein
LGGKIDQKCQNSALEKSRRFGVFLTPFFTFWSEKCPIAIYRKTGPTKSTVLGPDPPPGKFIEIYRFYRFFTNLGPSIEPEKPSPKSASTPYPPKNDHFIAILLKFYVWPGFSIISILLRRFCMLLFHPQNCINKRKTIRSFSVYLFVFLTLFNLSGLVSV